jgi:dipeptidyl-peptidase-4
MLPEKIYFIHATEESPVTKNLYLLNLKKGTSKRITTGSFLHNASISADGNYIIDNYSGPANPKTIQLVEVKTGKAKSLLQSANPLAAYSTGELIFLQLRIMKVPTYTAGCLNL